MTTGIVEGMRDRKNTFAWLVRVVRAWSDSIYIWKRVSSARMYALEGGPFQEHFETRWLMNA